MHFHRQAWVEPTLDAAATHFRSAAAAGDPAARGALLLTQAAGETVFEWLREQPQVGAWTVEHVPAERQSLWLNSAADRLLVVCGRQIQAERGLEVLALGTALKVDDRLGLEETLDRVRAADALPVLPWGFGKWLGSRGERIRELIKADLIKGHLIKGHLIKGQAHNDLWLGDNGGRLRGLPKPRLLDEGERLGLPILPGTDPFPFGGDYRRVGSFGCLLDGPVDVSRPWESIAARLRALDRSPAAYGSCTGWLRFGVNQVRIQLHMRRQGRSTT